MTDINRINPTWKNWRPAVNKDKQGEQEKESREEEEEQSDNNSPKKDDSEDGHIDEIV